MGRCPHGSGWGVSCSAVAVLLVVVNAPKIHIKKEESEEEEEQGEDEEDKEDEEEEEKGEKEGSL